MHRSINKYRRSHTKTKKQRGGLLTGAFDSRMWYDYQEILDGTKDKVGNVIDEVKAKKIRKEFLHENFAFFTSIMAVVATKNKLDYAPFGPNSEESKEIQDYKLRALFKAISELDTTAFGVEKNDHGWPLGGHGVAQQSALVSRTVGSKISRIPNIIPNRKNMELFGEAAGAPSRAANRILAIDPWADGKRPWSD
jgi:hypothetical protein